MPRKKIKKQSPTPLIAATVPLGADDSSSDTKEMVDDEAKEEVKARD